MMHDYKDGDVIHWTMVWEQSVDAWAVVINAGSGQVRIVHGHAKATHGRTIHNWYPGATTHIAGPSTKQVTVNYVPPDEVPDEVLVALAKRALLGEAG